MSPRRGRAVLLQHRVTSDGEEGIFVLHADRAVLARLRAL